MDKRVTIYTIANQLDISSTTVYRALHNKPLVSEKTRKAVLKTANELGFKANTLAQSLARKPVHLAVYVMSSFPGFHEPVLKGARQSAEELIDYNVIVDFIEFNTHGNIEEGAAFLKKTLQQIADKGYNGILIQTGGLEEFSFLNDWDIPIATVVNDIPKAKRKFCIQYDGVAGGRLAGELLYWRLGENAKVAVASGFKEVEIHSQTVRGFFDQVKKMPLNVVDIFYNHDNEELAYKNTNKLIQDHPDIRGIYVNTFNSMGVIRSVIEHGLDRKICLITSDINNEIKDYLDKGIISATIFQNQYYQGKLALRYLYQCIAENLKVDDTILIKPEVVFSSNMTFYE